MEEKQKRNKKGIIISFILGVILASSITIYATNYFANQVTYKDGKTVEYALNDLYNRLNNSSIEETNDINDFEPTIQSFGKNLLSIKVDNITTKNEVNILGYIWIINGKAKGVTDSEKNSFIYENTENLEEYRIKVLAIDENAKIKSSREITQIVDNKLYLYYYGKEFSNTTGNWDNVVVAGSPTLTKNADSMNYIARNGVGNIGGSITTAKKIDVTNYTKLYIEYICSAPSNKRVGISTQRTYSNNNFGYVAEISLQDTSTKTIDFVNIANNTGEYYVQHYFNNNNSQSKSVNFTLYSMWME